MMVSAYLAMEKFVECCPLNAPGGAKQVYSLRLQRMITVMSNYLAIILIGHSFQIDTILHFFKTKSLDNYSSLFYWVY